MGLLFFGDIAQKEIFADILFSCQFSLSGVALWMAMSVGLSVDARLHAPLRKNCSNFGDPLTFHL